MRCQLESASFCFSFLFSFDVDKRERSKYAMLRVTDISDEKSNELINLQYYTSKQLSELLCVSTSLLNKLRMKGKGPKYVKIGYRSILYPASEVEKYVNSILQNSTSEKVGHQ